MPALSIVGRALPLLSLLWLGACNLSSATPTPLPTPSPALPQIEILFPAHNQQVIEGVIFDIDMLATDTAQGIDRIELRVDGSLLQTSHSLAAARSEYRVTMNWYAKGIGWHKFEAVAYRADGTASAPAIIALEVAPAP